MNIPEPSLLTLVTCNQFSRSNNFGMPEIKAQRSIFCVRKQRPGLRGRLRS